MEKEELIEKIKIAFSQEKYPENNILVDKINSSECMEIVKNFSGKLWIELNSDFLFSSKDNIYFFSKYAFKYFIPAFMIATINDFHGLDDMPDIVIGIFTVPEKTDIINLYEKLQSFEKIPSINNTLDHNVFKEMQLSSFEEKRQKYFESMNEFTNEQRLAIKLYLEYMKQYKDNLYNDPEIAYKRYEAWYEKNK